MLAIGTGSVAPSFTNIGSTNCLGRTSVSLTKRRKAGVRRSLRGRWLGNMVASPGLPEEPLQAGLEAVRAACWCARRPQAV
ncbi:hypothetical protein Aglo01_11390 [Actinokineospora globicatena]|nr:hypothetical protein Aglo01_11390 [Actinokineospora globicatena]